MLRAIVTSSMPEGLRPAPADVAARALVLERGAIAFGISWHGLSPAQAALVITHAARMLAGPGSAEAARLDAAAARFAAAHDLTAFSVGIAEDMARSERLAALRRHGHAVLPWPRPARLA
ncbi:hypothetical protein KPL78_02630 [Roseomonas sp. HJA6]|uniref:Uncharacterized protein n=1 Tax=Roseomonas alba TaxID=2846776 RepID=A0ABS7A351_9PROT|nr:hypothetical protein [Neoroseomonas alba]MBW6396721.1 hypothetical protein [Neoroseomonas alba]